MPLKSGAPRECTSKAPCGIVIGQFRNANNGHTCGPPSALYKGIVGTRGPQAPALFRRILFGKFKPQISHAPQTRFFEMAGRLRNPAQSIACKYLPIPPPFPRLRFSDLSVGQPFRRYRASKKEKKCLQAVKFEYFSRERLSCSLFRGSTATQKTFLQKQLRSPPSYAPQTRFHTVF